MKSHTDTAELEYGDDELSDGQKKAVRNLRNRGFSLKGIVRLTGYRESQVSRFLGISQLARLGDDS